MLAPLAGISDAPFRRICFEMGAGYACSEMISAKGLFYGDKNTHKLTEILPGEGTLGFQLFGHEPEIMAFAAKKLEPCGNAVLDINMGCPVPKVVKNFEGSYLMKDLDTAYDVVAATVEATSKPVTVKIRAGWDDSSKNAAAAAKVIERAGASAICVHGRTREQFYSGNADWNIIRDVKDAVSIPVIGNGDVFSMDDGYRMMKETGCDAVMIGRGALGNPWIFNGHVPTIEDKKKMMVRHFKDVSDLKGNHIAVLEMRKHIGWYLKGVPGAAKLRNEINQIEDRDKLISAIMNL